MRPDAEYRLRRRVWSFLKRRAPAGLHLVRELLASEGWTAILFGGVLRDLSIPLGRSRFRDVDIVVEGASSRQLEALFARFIRRETRFGGLSLRVLDCLVDIWPLEETWAFKRELIPPGVQFLPYSTFMNIEGAAAVLPSEDQTAMRLYASPLLAALRDASVDINLETNPFPELNSLRALVTIGRSGFSMSRMLARTVVSHLVHLSPQARSDVQVAHYGRLVLDESDFAFMMEELQRGLASEEAAPIHVALARARQLVLWERWMGV